MHEYFVHGFPFSYLDASGAEVTPSIRLISSDPAQNDWLAVNQVTLRQGDYLRRFDIVLYCNGMPVSIIELKKAGSERATVAAAHAQLQTYLREFPGVSVLRVHARVRRAVGGVRHAVHSAQPFFAVERRR
jgi:type I restriction enzyme R subunit